MIHEDDVRDLLRDPRLIPPVLSVYLNTDRREAAGRSMLATLRHLAKTAERTLRTTLTPESAAAREVLHGTIVPRFVEFLSGEVEPVPAIRAVAAFASLSPSKTQGHRLVTYTLPRPLRSQAHIDSRPYIRPLLFLLDEYERYAALVVDRKHARFFTVFLGEIEQIAEFTSDTPTRHDQGGWSQKRFQRHVDDHIAQHVYRVTDYAVKALKHLPTHRLILGGDAETIRLIRQHLPHALEARIAGTFPLDVHASLHAIRERTLAVASQAEHEEEARQVGILREALAHPGRAVQGLPETLRSLTDRRALTLIVKKGFHAEGALCPNCQALLAAAGPCPYCEKETEEVEDIVEHAIEHAHLDRVTTEFVTENLDLEALGNIGAILRY